MGTTKLEYIRVKRSEWHRGQSLKMCGHTSALSLVTFNNTCQRCCLGFVGIACGLTDQQMNRVPEFSFFPPQITGHPLLGCLLDQDKNLLGMPGHTHSASKLTVLLMAINDDLDLNDDNRERCLNQILEVGNAPFRFFFED